MTTQASKDKRPNPIVAAGSALARPRQTIAQTLDWVRQASTRQTLRWVDSSTKGTGEALSRLVNLPLVRRFAGVLRLDWLVGISDRVNLDKAEAEVKQLRQQYPQDSPSQLAHRIMVQKATQAGGVGLASSLLPGFAVALLAVDLAATTTLQTEMLYQIAAAYGMDLHDPSRKGEILGIFGLALGGRNALKAGLRFLRNVPLAGALIGAGTNATMLYALGYAACRFYEAKQAHTGDPQPEALQTIQQESERYLDVAMAQQAVMDQILAQLILASFPAKKWEDILPELQALQLDQASLDRLATHLQSPQPLGALIDQLNCDFAAPLLAQGRRIADRDGHRTEAEIKILDAVSDRCMTLGNVV